MHALLFLALLVGQPCPGGGACEADVAGIYLEGLSAAANAYNDGGSPESLVPVAKAIEALDKLAGRTPGPAEIARLVLQAAVAAAQSEREEMGAFLVHATEMEVLQLAAGQPGAPGVSALEMAGDLWLRVHRYEDAKRAYQRAADVLGMTPRIKDGLEKASR
jgi:tetratricopeptide (TPR) repeat protein